MNPNQNPDINPQEAATRFLNSRRSEVSDATVDAQKTGIIQFAQFCDEQNKQLNQLNGLDIQQFYDHLRNRGTLKKVSRRQYMVAVRQFLRYLERLDIAPQGISEKVHVPTIDKNEWKRDEEIDPDRVQQIVAYLGKYRYASFDHATLLLLWHTGIRVGSLCSLDLADVNHLEGDPVLELKHRPKQGTPLKNGADGERYVNLDESVATVLQDYIDVHRRDIQDDYGRDPVFTSKYGRASDTKVRNSCQYWTCPWTTGISSCECTEEPTRQSARLCEMSRTPHVIRAASITYWRRQDVPTEVVSDRMNVGAEVIERHYDRRSEEGKAEQRRKFLDSV